MIEILIGGRRVFTGESEETELDINRSVFDLLEPDKRKTDYTKTVSIAGSKEADEVFMAMFDVNFNVTSVSFDPSRRRSATISSDTIPQLIGYCQLTDVVILDERRHEYRVVFYGVIGDLFKNINGKRLKDIDWSDLDHTLTAANIEPTFTPTLGQGYVYPLINYGQFRFPTQSDFEPKHFRPWLFWKEIWDRIFSEAGIRYESDFLNSDKFKKLIFSCDEPMKISESDIADSLSQAAANGNQTISSNDTLVNFDTVVSGGANFSSSIYTAPENGSYNIAGLLRVRVVMIFQNRRTVVRFVVRHQRGATLIRSQRINSSFLSGDENVTRNIPYEIEFDSVEAGDTFRIVLEQVYYTGGTGGEFEFLTLGIGTIQLRDTANGTSLIEARLNEGVTNGSQIDIATMAAGKMLQKDFVMGVIKSFNLFYDRQPDGSILIEPYSDYYTTEVVDLTKRLATDREFIIKPLDQSKYKRYKYAYKSSDDFLNRAHREVYEETYGSVEIDIDNEFAKDTKTTELPWALPIMSTVGVVAPNVSYRVVPYLCNDNSEQDYEGNSIPKVLVWGGLKDSRFDFNLGFGNTLFTKQYPYAGQQDRLIYTDDNGIDLTFDLPPAVYWQNENSSSIEFIEDNGLYPQYHSKHIDEITNRNSKIIECYIYLDPFMYNQISFRKLYYIKNAYYRIYDIQGYTPERSQPTLCQFLKVEESAAPIPQRKSGLFDPVNATAERGNENPVVINRGSTFTGGDGVISLGDSNIVGGTNVLVTAKDSDIQGSDIVALGGSNQSLVDGTVSIVHNKAIVEVPDVFNYVYLGVEGSPFFVQFVFDGEFAGVDLILTDIPENEGKVVHMISEAIIDVKDSNLVDIELNTTKGTYVHMGATGWQKFN